MRISKCGIGETVKVTVTSDQSPVFVKNDTDSETNPDTEMKIIML